MALLFMDGFDHYSVTTGGADQLWDFDPVLYPLPTVISNEGGYTDTMPVLGGRGLRVPYRYSNTSYAGPGAILASPVPLIQGTELGIGFHIYMDNLPSSSIPGGIFGWGNGNTAHRMFRLFNNGTVELTNSFSSGTTYGTWSESLVADTLYHIEMQIVFHNTAGSVEVRVDGATVQTLTGISTLSSNQDVFFLSSCTNGGAGFTSPGPIYFDNIYIYDMTGSHNNDWLGERTVLTLLPDADGTPQDWTLSGGADGYALINQIPADPATDFISSGTSTDRSVFSLSNLPSSGYTILGIQPMVYAEKDASGTAEVTLGVISGAQEASANATLIQDQSTYKHVIIETDPNTGEPFSASAVDALEFFIERV